MGHRSDKHVIEGVEGREPKPTKYTKITVCAVALLLCALIPFTDIGRKMIRGFGQLLVGKPEVVTKEVEKIVKVPVEVKIPVVAEIEPEKNKTVSSHTESAKPLESLTKLSANSNIQLKTQVNMEPSTELASVDRGAAESYQIDYTVSIKLPKAAQTLEELETVNPELGSMFPELAGMTRTAKVSPYFYQMYKNKTDRTKKDATKLQVLLSRHNFFDLQTILNLTAENGRKVTIMQADMDVVSDGSDGDRLPSMPEDIVNSTHYQPSTSYFWKKQTEVPNPMAAGFKKRVENAKSELAAAGTSATRKTWLQERLKYLETTIEDMKWQSYLVAEYDPFIVIPVNMLVDKDDAFCPKAGDYAVVIYEDKLYPCIVGDGGPTYKVGEASLRMAKEINKRASPYSRPVSDLTVTYLVFPNSRETVKSAPNYQTWRKKCQELIDQIGGLSADYQLHNWSNTLPYSN